MVLSLKDRIEEIALMLTRVRSVLDTEGEVAVSKKVYEIFSEMEYWKNNPQNLYMLPVKNDALGRQVVVSILEGQKDDSKKTVAMIGHTDTVGISDYGHLQEFATEPEILIEKLAELNLSDEVREDLESGKYMFGRGIFDMKSGDAIIMALMEMWSKDLDNFSGNIVFGAVCDEEGNSCGMLTFVPELLKLKEERGFDYRAMIDPDYIAPAYPGDPLKYVYVGTVGKIMPSFYIVGKETHVGESFDGLDPNQIAAAITGRINLNPEFCDEVDGHVTLPPVTLKQRDLKPEYSVQIAKTASVFFSYATHISTPGEVMAKVKAAAQECFEQVVETINERYRIYCSMAHREFKPQPWVARTMTYDELYDLVKAEMGVELDVQISAYLESLSKDQTIDVRDKSMKIVEFVHNLWSDKDPVVIVYFTPPYYPHIYVQGKSEKETALIEAVRKAIDGATDEYEIVEKRFLPCISDLSYAAAPDDAAIEMLVSNTPGYGEIYNLPLKEMQELNLPVADIGTVGKDAHKFTERVETKFTFEVTPKLIYKTVMDILR